VCDYCDCRSHPAIASLSADHERLLHLLGELRQAATDGDRAAARPILEELHDRVGGHAAREETGVFTQLRAAGVESAYLDRFEHEHVQVHDLLADHHPDDWAGSALDLVELLRGHIAREESDLFPAAHQLLSPSQWDAVDRSEPTGAPA
jgi:hemerythrin-like domain-containing protein